MSTPILKSVDSLLQGIGGPAMTAQVPNNPRIGTFFRF